MTQAFVRLLCEDASFRYGSNADVQGRAVIAACVDYVFTTFRASSHELQRCWEVDGCRIGQGIVTTRGSMRSRWPRLSATS